MSIIRNWHSNPVIVREPMPWDRDDGIRITALSPTGEEIVTADEEADNQWNEVCRINEKVKEDYIVACSQKGGVKRPPPGWNTFSPALARYINEKQPDITGAILIRNLSLWQHHGRKYNHLKIDGRRYCFRSLNDLVEDCPYLKKSQIHACLKRLEKRFGVHFIVKRDKKQLWYAVGPKPLKIQDDDGLIRFNCDEATAHGLNAAILLGNIHYQLEKIPTVKKDAAGNKYAKVSPTYLKDHLPFSDDTIARTMKGLVEKGTLIKHSGDPTLFALTEGFVSTFVGQIQAPAEMNSAPAEVDSRPAELDDSPRTCHNKGHKECHNVTLDLGSAEPPQDLASLSSALSDGAMFLSELAQRVVQTLHKINSGKGGAGTAFPHTTVDDTDMPYDRTHLTDIDLPYDEISAEGFDLPVDLINWNETVREVTEHVDEVTLFWSINGIKWTQTDRKALKRFFLDNLFLGSSFFEEIYENINEESKPWIIGEVGAKRGKYDAHKFLRNVTSARHILKYLPQILFQIDSYAKLDEKTGTITHSGDGRFDLNFNFAYLMKAPNSRLVRLTDFQGLI